MHARQISNEHGEQESSTGRTREPRRNWANPPASFNVSIGHPVASGHRMAEEKIDFPSSTTIKKPHHNRWLMLIAAFKIAQALLFVAVGVGALRLVHKDIGDILLKLAHHLHFSPESRFVDFILDRATIVNDRLLRRFSIGLFAYAALGMTEGIGLYLEKAWGEYMTLLITASFLPWEIYEVFHRVTAVRAGLLVVNVLVFLYLLKVLVERGKQKRDGKLRVA
jgi:uncharacterized membrane protein (DUF2068 family)